MHIQIQIFSYQCIACKVLVFSLQKQLEGRRSKHQFVHVGINTPALKIYHI